MDVRKVAQTIPVLPDGALLLDVGGGDGAILNPLLDLQPRLRITSVDIAPTIGQLVRPDLRERITFHPGKSVRQYIDEGGEAPTAVFISDVFHHVRPQLREDLIRDLLDVFGSEPPFIMVKDLVPQGARSRLAFWADRNISGDREVSAISPAELTNLIRGVDPSLSVRATGLVNLDFPSYLLIFTRVSGHATRRGAVPSADAWPKSLTS
jgi:hypothetical protein